MGLALNKCYIIIQDYDSYSYLLCIPTLYKSLSDDHPYETDIIANGIVKKITEQLGLHKLIL